MNKFYFNHKSQITNYQKVMRKLEKPNWQKQKERKKRMWLIGLALLLLIPVGVGSAYFILNKTLANSSNADGDLQLADPEIQGNRIFVREGENFQKALNQAKAGDTILLQAGKTFKGAFKLPKKTGNKFIMIRTSANDSQLPPADTRIDPKKHAQFLPKLESNVNGEPVIFAGDGSHHYRFIGIEFKPTFKGLYNIIQLGTGEETNIEQLPHHIEFDRVYLYGDKDVGQRRGIAANGKHIVIVNSYFSDFKRKGEESQAIAAWATDGPIEIKNNFLEAAAESVLFGGAENKMKLVASDVMVTDNWMNKRIEWKGTDWVVKNFFEIKSGRRMKVSRNLMTNNWAMAQEGTGVLFRTGMDSGEQAVVEDIEFSDNIMRGSGGAINIFGGEGKGGRRLTIKNNIFDDIDVNKYGGRGYFIKSTTFDDVTIENNTVIHTGSISIAYGEPLRNFVFRNNIVFQNEYGFFGDGGLLRQKTLAKHFPKAVFSNNIIVGSDANTYGKNNFYPVSVRQIGFIAPKKGNYNLSENSVYKNRGFDGKQIGANLDPKTVGGKF
jgi:hypothetical protein